MMLGNTMMLRSAHNRCAVQGAPDQEQQGIIYNNWQPWMDPWMDPFATSLKVHCYNSHMIGTIGIFKFDAHTFI